MLKKNVPILLMLYAGVLLFPLAAHACPGCASALSKSLGSAFNASVLFMMAMPFTIFGAFVIGFIMLNRRNQKFSQQRRKQAQR